MIKITDYFNGTPIVNVSKKELEKRKNQPYDYIYILFIVTQKGDKVIWYWIDANPPVFLDRDDFNNSIKEQKIKRVYKIDNNRKVERYL